MHHHKQHLKAWRAVVIVLSMLIGTLAGRPGAYAQALSNASASGPDSPVGDAATTSADEGESTGAAEAPGTSYDSANANPIDDSATSPVENADISSSGSGSATASNEAPASASEDGAVLEIPQVVQPQDGSAADEGSGGAVASRHEDDEDSATADPAGQDTAALNGDAATAAQLGTLRDYENQANQAPPGPIFFAPGLAVARFPRPFLFNAPPRPLLRPPVATSPIILPPTSGGAFPSTSPMLMPPRLGIVGSFPRGARLGIVGSFPRGGLTGFHR
jgi:hypothetical protein